MAYGVYIAAVDPREIENLRAGAATVLRTRAVIGMSHLVVYWTKDRVLAEALRGIVDEGDALGEQFWHPLRPPIVHLREAITSLEAGLRMAWQALSAESQATQMFRNEIGELLSLLSSAVQDGSALVSVLEPPADEERASRVRCPFDDPEALPFPWGGLLEMEKARKAAAKGGPT